MANTSSYATDQSTGSSTSLYEQTTYGNVPVLKRSATSVQNKIRQYTRTSSTAENLRFPTEDIKYFVTLDYAKYVRNLSEQGRNVFLQVKFNREGSIHLPLPISGMADTHDVEYVEEGLGLTGAAATGLMGTFGGAQDGTSKLSAGAGAIGGFALQFADNFSAYQGTTGAIKALAGIAPNKFMTILLKGPKYKRHEFTWRLNPVGLDESATIRKIITKLNNLMAVGLAASGTLWTFPYIFYIKYIPNSDYLYKFKPAVLESMTVNYVPSGTPAFYTPPTGAQGNPPDAVELRLRFMELEYWLAGQFNDAKQGAEGADTSRDITIGTVQDVTDIYNGLTNAYDQATTAASDFFKKGTGNQ